MMPDDRDIDTQLRAALQDEARRMWPPATLWPRVQAQLARPAESAPALTRPPDKLRNLLRQGDRRGLTLALLAEREMDAFTLARRIDDVARANGRPSPPEGGALPALHLLERDGLINARWLPGPRGVRRAYALSARGQRVRRLALAPEWLLRLGSRLEGFIPRRVTQRL